MRLILILLAAFLFTSTRVAAADIAVRGDIVHTMVGEPIEDGVVIIRDGKITEVGPAADIQIPEGMRTIQAAVVVPGFIDARGTLGLTGILNQPHDQDQLDPSTSIQPELRAIDAYNPLDPLVEYVRKYGVTTVHTGHAPGALISGQTSLVKTRGTTVEEALVKEAVMIAATLGDGARRSGRESPGTRGKMVAMLRQELLEAQAYLSKQQTEDEKERPARNLKLEALGKVLEGELPLLINADRTQDIASALRLAEEFDLKIVLESAAESYLLIDEIKAAGVPVLIHPLMQRAFGERENQSFETPAKLRAAGIPVAFQTGFESYVPKVRVLLFEAQVAAANGMSFQDTLSSITRDAAQILGIADRVGTLEPGKDGDLALFDGDPFEYTSHCTGTIIEGELLNEASN